MNDFFNMFNSDKEMSEKDMIEFVNEIGNVFGNGNFENAFNNALEEALSTPKSTAEIFDELTDNYYTLINILEINDFKKFHFPDYDDCRRVSVDGKEYDFNDCFDHNDDDATEALYAIDCLIADLQSNGKTGVLKKIENKINKSR